MFSISFPCPACGRWLNAQEHQVGKSCQCPHCGKAVLIPEAASVKEVLEPTLHPTAAFAVSPAEKINPHEQGTLHPDESVEDRPVSQLGTLSPNQESIVPPSLAATESSIGDAPLQSDKKLPANPRKLGRPPMSIRSAPCSTSCLPGNRPSGVKPPSTPSCWSLARSRRRLRAFSPSFHAISKRFA